MLLVCTSDRRFWTTDGPMLFLGPWCHVYGEPPPPPGYEHKTLPYHWDDRLKLRRDYDAISAHYETWLKRLKAALNTVHRSQHSERFWRIVVGPWLRTFVEIVFDRMASVEQAHKSGLVSRVKLGSQVVNWAPRDQGQFISYFCDAGYNQHLFSLLIKRFEFFPTEELVHVEPSALQEIKPPSTYVRRALSAVKYQLAASNAKLVCKSNFAGIFPYLSNEDALALHLRFDSLPLVYPHHLPMADTVPLERTVRKSLFPNDFVAVSSFDAVLRDFIPWHLPTAYLEDYPRMLEQSLKALPRKPRVILTANGHFSSECFQYWAGWHVDRGAKCIVVQHGGNLGSAAFSSAEDHELAIADRYFSWGWRKKKCPNIVPLPAATTRKLAKSIMPVSSGKLLLVLNTFPLFSYRMFAGVIGASGMEHYIQEQFSFIHSLSPCCQNLLSIRFFPGDYGLRERERFRDAFPNISTDTSPNIGEAFNAARLHIATTNTTGILEGLIANFPTIAFWDPLQWELRPEARPYFDALRDVGILYDSPGAAAAHANSIVEQVGSWWRSAKVQDARKYFCSNQARPAGKCWLDAWQREIEKC